MSSRLIVDELNLIQSERESDEEDSIWTRFGASWSCATERVRAAFLRASRAAENKDWKRTVPAAIRISFESTND